MRPQEEEPPPQNCGPGAGRVKVGCLEGGAGAGCQVMDALGHSSPKSDSSVIAGGGADRVTQARAVLAKIITGGNSLLSRFYVNVVEQSTVNTK